MMLAFKDVYELCRNALAHDPVPRLSDTQLQQIEGLREPGIREIKESPHKER